jgi:hypothetical protein
MGRIMPVASKRPRRLSDADLERLLALLGGRRRRRAEADGAKQGVDLSGEQQAKTALTYFSRGLKVKATADA